MTAIDSRTLPEPFSPEFVPDPYPTLAALRATEPVTKVQAAFLMNPEAWLVTRYDLAKRVLSDPRIGRRHPDEEGPLNFDSDPPDHTRLRKLVQQAFTHHRVQGLRTAIQRMADETIDAFAGAGTADLMEQFAFALPIAVISELLGVPADERADVRRRTAKFVDGEQIEPRIEAFKLTYPYIIELVARKRRNPGDDLTSALVAARDGEDKLEETELVTLLMTVLVAGYITTTSLIGNGMYSLFTNPDQLALLRSKPALLPTAVDEFLRYQTPFSAVATFPREAMSIGDVQVQANDCVLVSLHAANRDPAVFADPDRLDITRDPNPHLAFTAGIHRCLGAPLARMEGEIAIGTLLRRFPDLRLSGPAQWRGLGMRGLDQLPVEFTPVA
ncbi:cytochrome P450 [Kutzneria sp. NPDC051319]|uniref:cytochrome P450 family protein n=1 Tax=Kutzneria sp. NPDC051319 TaxID=3155047 RepID=UPI00341780F6